MRWDLGQPGERRRICEAAIIRTNRQEHGVGDEALAFKNHGNNPLVPRERSEELCRDFFEPRARKESGAKKQNHCLGGGIRNSGQEKYLERNLLSQTYFHSALADNQQINIFPKQRFVGTKNYQRQELSAPRIVGKRISLSIWLTCRSGSTTWSTTTNHSLNA